MDQAKQFFDDGQALLREATQTGDPITAMRGRALCHRAIEMRWYTHTEGNLLDPPWVKRCIVQVGNIRHEAPGPNLGVGDQDFYDWLNAEKAPKAEPVNEQLSLPLHTPTGGETHRAGATPREGVRPSTTERPPAVCSRQ